MIFASTKATQASRFYWSIQPIYSLIMLFGTLLCFSLGIWQFNKSFQFEHKDVPSTWIKGHYLNGPHLLLDNRTHEGVAGYHVYSPFVTPNNQYLINRGFIAIGSDRNKIPVLDTPDNEIEIEGVLQFPAKPMVLSENQGGNQFDEIASSIFRVQTIHIPSISDQFELPLEEQTLQLIKGEGQQTPLPKLEPYMNQHKHLAYAVQWWLLTVASVVIWLASSLKRTPSMQHDKEYHD